MSIGPYFWRVLLIAAVIILSFTATYAARRNRLRPRLNGKKRVSSPARRVVIQASSLETAK